MKKGRLEAFSDGVLAIIITIMVLDFKVPHGSEFSDLLPLIPLFLSYILSFIYIGIYWNNHHHLFQAVREVSGSVLWANLHLLFWLSLVPFITAWAGENHFINMPVALYGFVLLMAGVAYYILTKVLLSCDKNPVLAQAIGKDYKGLSSMILYLVAIGFAFYIPWIACLIYILVAAIWLIPDRRISKVLNHAEQNHQNSVS
jgi:uncharacterized membrane protein